MDATLKGILALLAEGDGETRCAALLVLTRLKVSEPRAVAAVSELLAAKNAIVRDFALTYLEQVRPAGVIAQLLPLLDSEDAGLRQRVAELLASYGQAAVAAARKLMKDAPRRRAYAIVDIAARVRSASALDLLFELLASDDLELNRAACDALIGHLPTLTPAERTTLFTRSEQLAAAAKESRPAAVAAAKLLGALADPKARKALFAQLEHPDHSVRTHALSAAVQCLRGQKLSGAEIDRLLPLLDSDDEQGVLRPVTRLLDEQSLDRAYLPRLNRLAESPQPLVKRFAVQKLGAFDSGNVVKTLIGYLTDDSYARRDQATSSLKSLPAARAALMKELLECDDERKAWTLADILLAHDRSWKRDALAALHKKLEAAVEKGDGRLYTAYFHFLNTLDPEATAAAVRERAEQLRKSKKFPLVVKWLTLLRDSPALDAEAKYNLAIAELKSHKHALAATIRRHDPALELLRDLDASRFPAAERLRKERLLTPEELFYIAFNFAEAGPQQRELAAELFELLASKHGRTKLGKAAKNKLQLLQRT